MSMSYMSFHKLSKREQESYLEKLRANEQELELRLALVQAELQAVRVQLHTLAPVPARELYHDPALDEVPVRVIPPKTKSRRSAPTIVLRPLGSPQ